MARVTYAQVVARSPDRILPPDEEFAAEYQSRVAAGAAAASGRSAVFVAICRNAMPWLPLTVEKVREAGSHFREWRCYIHENDSTDGTKEFLKTLDSRFTVCSFDNGRPHLNYTKSQDRTVSLAEYRNACRDWVAANGSDSEYTIVFDTDPWGGWSTEGVMNTIGHLESPEYANVAGMGSYSLCEWGPPVWPAGRAWCHYDGWACRWTWWKERQDMMWFHTWHPPVGSPPVKMNSCFGQLAVYRTSNYLRGVYRGGDCEHVNHWRTCGGDCYLNPSQRVVSFWVPDEESDSDRLHDDIHTDVDGRNADENHCGNT